MQKQTKENAPTFSLSERAILVDLNIGRWYARKKDTKVTAEVAAQHNTDKKAGNYRKNLLPFEAPSYEAILAVVNEARVFHRENTLPWSDTGLRVLPNANYETYTTGMRKRERDFNAAVEVFVPDFPALKDKARGKLNGMFRDADYPEAEVLRAAFSFEVVNYPLPETDDLRVKLTDNQVSAIKKQIDKTLRNATDAALRDGWNRLLEAVQHAREIFANPKARVTRALFDNLNATCDLLTRLNPTDDANFSAMTAEVKDGIASLDRRMVRKSKDVRGEAEKRAAAIEKKMAGFMRGVAVAK
jgi:hypothetical protein